MGVCPLRETHLSKNDNEDARTPSRVRSVCAALAAQSFNSTLLGTHNLHALYSGCWGYVAPNGKEYALLGATTGTVVVDCSVPTAPVERGFFPGPINGWREIRTWSTYAYVTTEGGGGLQIIDLTNPDAPVLLPTWQPGLFSHAHNIGIDLGTGRVHVCGTNTGMVVADASVHPANPTFIGSYASDVAIAAQIVPIDLGSPNGFLASSDGLRLRVCLQ